MNCLKIMARFWCIILGTKWVCNCKFAPSRWKCHKYVHLKTHWASCTMHQNLAVILQLVNYSKNSFIVLIPGVINKLESCLAMQRWNKAIWLVKNNHETWNSQIYFWNWVHVYGMLYLKFRPNTFILTFLFNFTIQWQTNSKKTISRSDQTNHGKALGIRTQGFIIWRMECGDESTELKWMLNLIGSILRTVVSGPQLVKLLLPIKRIAVWTPFHHQKNIFIFSVHWQQLR